jgi:hypothetical protein
MRVLLKNTHREIREYPPTRRTVKICCYTTNTASKPEGLLWAKNYYLWFPYQLFIFKKMAQRPLVVGLTTKPIQDQEPKGLVYFPPLPNIFENFSVCLGEAKYTKFDQAISNFWQSPFVEIEKKRDHCQWSGIIHGLYNGLLYLMTGCSYSSSAVVPDFSKVLAQSYEKWQQMSLGQVNEVLSTSSSITYKYFSEL